MSVGQKAYETYGQYLLAHDWQGIWPPWENLTSLMHDAWNAAASAAEQKVE